MQNKYISYYFRNLCVETFPSYGTDTYYDTCIYEHFFEILLRLTDSKKNFDILIFIDKYLQKLDGNKYKKKFAELSKLDYLDAKRDFIKLISNIYQITLIYKYRENLVYLEEELSNLEGSYIEKFGNLYNLDSATTDLLDDALLQVKDAFLSKVGYKYNIDTYDSALAETLVTVEEKLTSLKIEDIVSQSSGEVDGYKQEVFNRTKEEILESFGQLAIIIEDTFSNNRKVRHLKNVDYYLSFLMHDKIMVLEASTSSNKKATKKIFKKFYNALYYSYKMSLYFSYFKDKHEKFTLKEVLASFNDDLLKVGIGEDYIDRRLEDTFFNIVDNLKVRKDFKHLPLIILGYELSLDAKTIEKISVQVDNNGYITNNKKKNSKIISRFKDLKYSTNTQKIYDLDEDIGDFLELFSSYKTKTIYEVSVVHEDGNLETISFDSKEDYINYITPDCDEDKVKYMMDNFLRERDKKVYYEPLFSQDC
ncbi:hypothetical protein [Candidatus Sulfurimonas baltica]|uniref:Uncharacterized protein n=1 Tax=Candidatus Sulfurimonas baltica TaxID=2740404 RepID=A0A7S7RLA1_9BACT|nr:hypothetical protein [Candidatus Sulfurimonas baltica]QOY50907.1 hypothetical protein HUE88_07060 [Candidatus Sulfurimonas baltica]